MRFPGRLVRYADARRFGVLDVVDEGELARHPLLAHLGPEPLEAGFSAEWLYERTRGRAVATKTFLMDAQHVVGVGNIYASEACFRAGVRPRRAVAGLTRAECERLVLAVREVLTEAVECGGTTLRDYIGVDEDAGFFRRELRVYDREGEPCVACGAPIRRVVVGARSTYYCAHCQR
jgi:formamidopyrimidine-DNA glycosylase